MDRRARTFAERLLRRLVRLLLPPGFRSEWGEEIVRTSLERAADARRRSVLSLATFVLRELVALVVVAVAARRRSRVSRPERCIMLTDPEDTRPYRVAWVIALLIHFAAFVVVFPFAGTELEATPERELTVITPYVPPEPPERSEREMVKRRADPVPIPDPTPDAPEPIVSEAEVRYVEVEAPDLEFAVHAPVGPPVEHTQEVLRGGVDVQRPERLVYVEPEYPELARRARLECTVILSTRIGREGDVLDVEVLRGCGLGLDEAAVRAVSGWRYAPTTVDGRPVEVAMTVTVVFRLR